LEASASRFLQGRIKACITNWELGTHIALDYITGHAQRGKKPQYA